MKFYRYTDQCVCPPEDGFGQGWVGAPDAYEVIGVTRFGVVLDVYGRRRFVLDGTRKTFAHPTVAEARDSYIARKKRQARILSAQLRNTEARLALITKENQ